MNKNYILWVTGAIVVIVIGMMLFMQNPSYSPAPTTGAVDTTTNDLGTTGTGNPTKPFVTTTGFASVSTTTAVVVGTVNPDGAKTTYWFEYGPTTSLGLQTTIVTMEASYQQAGASAYLTGLKPGTQYYFRLGAKNAYGTTFGALYNFITAAK